MTEKDLNKVLNDVANSIKHLVSDLERREQNGEVLKSTEVRAIAEQLHSHVMDLLGAVGQLPEDEASK